MQQLIDFGRRDSFVPPDPTGLSGLPDVDHFLHIVIDEFTIDNRDMRAVVQRVSRAEVRIDGEVVASIGRGFLVLVGFTHTDGEEELAWTARKLAGLRVFEDENGRMNLSLADVGGEVLVVSQFTLYADIRKGRRPAFIDAAEPDVAEKLYDRFCDMLTEEGVLVKKGVFGAKMEVELINDGPVAIIIKK